MPSGIYEIVNTVNNHKYVGQASNLNKRAGIHWSRLRAGTHHNLHLQAAWDKYGEETFTFNVLEVVDIPYGLSITERRDFLVPYEQMWMDKLKPQYNLAPAAGTVMGYKHTPEAKAKMSESRMGNKSTTGHKNSEETRAKKRRSALLRHHPLDVVEELMLKPYQQRAFRKKPEDVPHGNIGKPKPPEVREKIRQSHLARIERLKSEES